MIEMKIDKNSEAFVEVEINDDIVSLGIKRGKEILDTIIFFDLLPLNHNKIQQFAIYVNKHGMMDYNQDTMTLFLEEVTYE